MQWGLENIGQPIDDINGPVVMGMPDADIDVDGRLGQLRAAPARRRRRRHRHHVPAPRPARRDRRAIPGERGGGREANGIDDDGNGFVDDWRGWDFAADDNLPADGHGHGTHVAGTVLASADEDGVVGVAPEAACSCCRR